MQAALGIAPEVCNEGYQVWGGGAGGGVQGIGNTVREGVENRKSVYKDTRRRATARGCVSMM